ncbi:MAG TPA: quinone oxidoreductase, partial [Polyangiaceae bacterium]|nr:quinone oxidoreductase [Polyangiaceae bacterium]
LPAIPGLEGAGVVEALGPEVTTLRVGDRVAWSDRVGASRGGTYATHVIVPEARAVRVPAEVTLPIAAASMLQGMTAHYLSHATFPLGPSHTCLVHAAAGGVGLLLCQMAKKLGARVIGTVSTPEKAALARRAGADEIIFYTEQDFAPEAKRLTGGRGVDVVYDSVGKTTFDKSLDALAGRGMLVLFGQSSGRVGPFDPQVLNGKGSLFLTRPSLYHYVRTREELMARAEEVLAWVKRGELEVRIGATFPLSRAADAHRALEGRTTTGKVVLVP